MVGAKPRGPGMERADLLNQNGEIFQVQVSDGHGSARLTANRASRFEASSLNYLNPKQPVIQLQVHPPAVPYFIGKIQGECSPLPTAPCRAAH
jgi:hypothetical protein